MDTETLIAPLIGALKEHHPQSNGAEIERAFKIARTAHEGQLRKSGEDYITHPVAVLTSILTFVPPPDEQSSSAVQSVHSTRSFVAPVGKAAKVYVFSIAG